jgi:hypothetical protein
MLKLREDYILKSSDPEEYIKLAQEVQQKAKEATISLLRNYVEGQQIDSEKLDHPEYYWLFVRNGDWDTIQLYAYGLNEEGELCFKANYPNSCEYYRDGEWCSFEEHFVREQYHYVYEIVLDHVQSLLEEE